MTAQFSNVFTGDAYGAIEMTASVNLIEPTPTVFADVFTPRKLTTTFARVERRERVLSTVGFSDRGTPGTPHIRTKGKAFMVETERLAKFADIKPQHIQDQVAFGSNQLETADRVLNEVQVEMAADCDASTEVCRAAVMKGKVLDPNTLEEVDNYHSKFGLAPSAPVELNFASSAASGSLRLAIMQARRAAHHALKQAPVKLWRGIADPNLMDLFSTCKETRELWIATADKAELAGGEMTSFNYGGVQWVWAPARIADRGILADYEGMIFPVGVKDAFMEYLSPPDIFGFENQEPQNAYSFMYVNDERDNARVHQRRFFRQVNMIPDAVIQVRKA